MRVDEAALQNNCGSVEGEVVDGEKGQGGRRFALNLLDFDRRIDTPDELGASFQRRRLGIHRLDESSCFAFFKPIRIEHYSSYTVLVMVLIVQ